MLGFEVSDVVVRKVQIFNILNQLLNASHNCKATVVRDMSEKHVKIYNGVPIAIGKIAIGHGDFIEIREHREISGGLLFICHGNISTIKVTGKRTLQVSMCPGGKKGPENDPIQHKAI